MDGPVAAQSRVVATAGHVDHGKSSLIVALTGMDPDRWDEEKRRGLTIDLGYAWCTLPSGREIAFVDVPGHERFIGNMLAGVGPVRSVLFVVAADEGWKPQSEEHLQILDVLGAGSAVVALTKRDLVDEETVAIATEEVRDRLAGTALSDAPIVPVSASTGDGIDALRAALDDMLERVPPPDPARTRLHVDRVFTIKGAGTVVTGTLTGDCLSVGDDVVLLPSNRRARIRSLQSHRTVHDRACPVSRVAINLVGVERDDVARGVVLARPDAWRSTERFEATLRPVRGLRHDVGPRGAYKVYAGTTEVDARIRVYGGGPIAPGDDAFVRIHTSSPLTLDVFDRFVVREAGRQETVAGGRILDVDPPGRAGPAPEARLASWARADRDALPGLLADERGAVRALDAALLTGSEAPGGIVVGSWFVRPGLVDEVERNVTERLRAHHEAHPLEEGAEIGAVRAAVTAVLRADRVPADPELVEAMIQGLADRAVVVMSGSVMHLPDHGVSLDEHDDTVVRLLDAIGGEHATMPPTIDELERSGIERSVVEAAGRAGLVVQVSPDLIFSPAVVGRALAVVRAAPDGITVSVFREALETSRKFALPLLEHFDRTGVTRRDGNLRFPR
ncbi:MAG TPA: selenocysteine-specific translation elongation factor [Actinomycetota bacterium]|nr:selenocysteine-specific translation elongation factor [Actinomycetota bacterium]